MLHERKHETVTTWNTHTHQSSLPSWATGEDSRPNGGGGGGGNHSTGSFQKASSAITDLQGPFPRHSRQKQRRRRRSRGSQSAPKARGEAGTGKATCLSKGCPSAASAEAGPQGGGQGRAGRRQDISLSLYLDYLKFLKNKRKKRERRGNEAGNEFTHRELTSHSGQNQSPSGSDVSLRHLA